MKVSDIRDRAFAMPLANPSYPPALAAVAPEPLEMVEPLVTCEFIGMPDFTGFGDDTETGQVIPVRLGTEPGVYVHSMYLDDDAPIAGGRENRGFPKKLASPKRVHEG